MKKHTRWGATPGEWDMLVDAWGLGTDLVPIVSNPEAVISKDSSLTSLGKMPSKYRSDGTVCSIAGWQLRRSNPARVAQWRNHPDIGAGVICRRFKGLDLDILDRSQVRAMLKIIKRFLADRGMELPPIRWRKGAEKILLPIIIDEPTGKGVIRTEHGIVEFLGTKQQFVAAGTHPSGHRYEWEGTDRPVPEISLTDFWILWALLAEKFADHTQKNPVRYKPYQDPKTKAELAEFCNGAADSNSDEPVYRALFDRGMVKEVSDDGIGFFIQCPNHAEHSTDSSASATKYYAPDTGGHHHAAIVCLHSHCEPLGTIGLAAKLGINLLPDGDEMFEDLEEFNDFVDLDEVEEAEESAVVQVYQQEELAAECADAEAVTHFFNRMPKIVQDLVVSTEVSARYSQRGSLVGAALSALGAVAARKFTTDFGRLSTAQFMLFTAPPGGGKDAMNDLANDVMEAVGLSHVVEPEFPGSTVGLYDTLKGRSNGFMYIIKDECATELPSVIGGDTKMNAHLVGVGNALTLIRTLGRKSFSRAALSNRNKSKADSEATPGIRHAQVAVAAFTTPSGLAKAITEYACSSGRLPRYIVLESNDLAEYNRHFGAPPDLSRVVEWHDAIEARFDSYEEDVVEADFGGEPVGESFTSIVHTETGVARKLEDIPLSPRAKEIAHEWAESNRAADVSLVEQGKDNEARRFIVARRPMLAHGLALLLALLRDPGAQEIGASDYQLGLDFVTYHQERFIKNRLAQAGQSDFAALEDEVVRVVRSQAGKGQSKRGMTVAELQNYCRPFKNVSRGVEREDVLKSLCASGRLRGVRPPPGKKGPIRYLPG